MEFTFINTTTNLLKINAAAGDTIDDSDDNSGGGVQDYELYSGTDGTNGWPWSSVTVTLAEDDWWHVTSARGDWTTVGATPEKDKANTNLMPVAFIDSYGYYASKHTTLTGTTPEITGDSAQYTITASATTTFTLAADAKRWGFTIVVSGAQTLNFPGTWDVINADFDGTAADIHIINVWPKGADDWYVMAVNGVAP